ncbi:hypothetical protein RD792_007494 [Penstemon davidsonii]|uniref:MLO-like protein n=1 Tax=Penstemon davidsonii TaxID=160366 RepID=A0ABR0D6L0_9LAMI|nr:hypothetical protein RD792_007492 [Penstemon davidsonii]KAK4484893.1 hypothetical protein RD792_007494 [Penstemon davidsonii]
MSESQSMNMLDSTKELRSLALTPTWSVATVLTIFVAVSLLVERSIHRLGNWLKKTDRKPLVAALEKMKEEITRALTMQRQSSFVRVHTSNPMERNSFLVWVTCFFRQFGRSVVRADYLTLRQGFITNHNLTSKYDFHSYMIRSMEEEFQRIVGVSAPLWGFVVAFMLFNVKGSNLYFWIALIPVTLVLLVGTKLQHVIATLALESAGLSGSFSGPKFKPRDELFWFNKPELLLSLIHFILFQNAFELASFFWFWMGTNYKAALIPQGIRETIHGWGKAARRRRRRMGGIYTDDSTVHTDTDTVLSVEEYDDSQLLDSPRFAHQEKSADIELQQVTTINETSSRVGTPLLRPSASISSPVSLRILPEMIARSSSMPR